MESLSTTGERTYFSWSRINLSWAFRLPLPTLVAPYFETLDLDPKLGIYSLDSRFEVTGANGKPQMANFKLDRAIDLGFEAGLEHTFPMALLRLWGGYNYSASIVLQTKTSLSSVKGGVDVYWPLANFGANTTLKFLTFGSGEILSMGKKSAAKSDATDYEEVIKGLSYQLIFLGIGGTISW